ncbi:MAG TPA: tetratricopeptide repeat protein [Micromonosporaceae bacterium]|nr:tetratricopeptide repeat protein [Micromonosporaceae bacterium]
MHTAEEPEPLRRALQLGLEKRYAEAIVILREYLATYPDSSLAWRRLAGAFLGAGEPAEAELAAKEAVAHAPDDPVAHRMLGVALYHGGKPGQAAEVASRAIELDGHDPEAHALLAYALLEEPKSWTQARAEANRAVELGPHNRAALDVRTRVRRLRLAGVAVFAYAAGTAIAFVLLTVAGIIALGGSAPGIWYLVGTGAATAAIATAAVLFLRQDSDEEEGFIRIGTRPAARLGYLEAAGACVVAGLATWGAAAAAGGRQSTQIGMAVLAAVVTALVYGSAMQHAHRPVGES